MKKFLLALCAALIFFSGSAVTLAAWSEKLEAACNLHIQREAQVIVPAAWLEPPEEIPEESLPAGTIETPPIPGTEEPGAEPGAEQPGTAEPTEPDTPADTVSPPGPAETPPETTAPSQPEPKTETPAEPSHSEPADNAPNGSEPGPNP